jgi:dihydrofolate reductase
VTASGPREIRDRHEHVKVVGSLNLVQTLLHEEPFDRLDFWVHSVVLGVGKKVFDGGAVPRATTEAACAAGCLAQRPSTWAHLRCVQEQRSGQHFYRAGPGQVIAAEGIDR